MRNAEIEIVIEYCVNDSVCEGVRLVIAVLCCQSDDILVFMSNY